MTEQSFPIQLRTSIEGRGAEFAAMLKPLDISHERFMRVALLYVTKNPKLWKCTKQSVFLSIMEAARAGLMVDGKEAAIVPFGDEAELMPMVKGIINLMLRSTGVQQVESRVVRQGDDFYYEYGLNPRLEHVPKSRDGDLEYAYAIVRRKDVLPLFDVMDWKEITEIRQRSRAPNSPAWINYESEMGRKMITKRTSKLVDLSPEAQRLIAIDNAVTGSPWGQDYVDGVSDEYQNQLTKSHTQAGIDRLKDQMENGDKPEPELKTEPEPEPKTDPEPEPRAKNKWEPFIVNFLVETQLVDGKDAKQVKLHIRKILNRSPFMDVPFGDLELVDALAFVLGRLLVIEEYPQLESKARYALLLEWWADDEKRNDLIDRALKMIPPEELAE